MHFLQVINSDLSVLIVCNKTGGTIKILSTSGGHGCLSVVIVVCCQVEVSATN